MISETDEAMKRVRTGVGGHVSRLRRLLWLSFGATFALVSAVVASQREGGRGQSVAVPEFGDRVDVELVIVDVVVTDRARQRVLDVARDEFVLEVDGRQIPIDQFSGPQVSAPDSGHARALAANQAPADLGHLLIFLDLGALDGRTAREFVEQVRSFVLDPSHRGARISVAVFTDMMQLIVTGAEDTLDIEQAFDEVVRVSGRGSLLELERRHIEEQIRSRGNFRFSSGSADSESAREIANQIRQLAEQETRRHRRMVSALTHWTSTFGGIDDRKSLLVASPGFTADPAAYLWDLLDMIDRSGGASGPVRRGSLQSTDLTAASDFERIYRAAQDARVTVYAMTPTASAPVQAGAEHRSLGLSTWTVAPRDSAVADARANLTRLADVTGGQAFVIGPALGEQLQSIAADARGGYSISFLTGPEAGFEPHSIRVRVTRAGLEVRSRASYRRYRATERREEALAAAAAAGLVNGLMNLTIQSGDASSPQDRKSVLSVPLTLRIPLGAISLREDNAQGTYSGMVEARFAVSDSIGDLHLGEPESIAIDIPATDIERAREAFWVHRSTIEVTAGEIRVGALVVDRATGDWATAATSITVP
ncbi:MAG: VWA domain-containing protein [Thermoanaerobaculia bacterium]|nr:MAG: VWA domain-containing protein [Thermoanaerobaculia bacterium]